MLESDRKRIGIRDHVTMREVAPHLHHQLLPCSRTEMRLDQDVGTRERARCEQEEGDYWR